MKREGIVYRLRCYECGAGVDNRAAPCVCDVPDDPAGPRGLVITRRSRILVESVSGSFEHDASKGN